MPRIEELTPKQIVKELDRFIVGQGEAKKAVSIAIRNRWRRQQLRGALKEEIMPKNILMIGPTGVGKTEIARRLSNLVKAPFIKVEATKFTELGYVGRDVEQIIRDLVEIAIHAEREYMTERNRERALKSAQDRIINIIAGDKSSNLTREQVQKMMESHELEDHEVEIFLRPTSRQPQDLPMFDVPGSPGLQMSMINVGDMFSKVFQGKSKKKRMKVRDARKALQREESERMIDEDKIISSAMRSVEENGIVFIDEIDKVCSNDDKMSSSNVSREGVQRDLLPLIEGCTVPTKRGPIRTEHILFITSGAFHIAKPSDLLPELQGRLPIRVELKALTKDDFEKILHEPESSLIKQYKALLSTENITLEFTDDSISEIAEVAAFLNSSIENIGARRLHTLMEKLVEDVSFSCDEHCGQIVTIDSAFVKSKLGELSTNTDLSRFIL